jgi:hypothetical protein
MNDKDLLNELPRNIYLFTHKESGTNFVFSDGFTNLDGDFVQDVQIQTLK